MIQSEKHNQKIAQLTFAAVYPHYQAKVERKGRTRDELHHVIQWLTGFSPTAIQQLIDARATFEEFFSKATIHPNANRITGVICGVRIENIENELTQNVRRLDKLVDELAKGKSLETICRS